MRYPSGENANETDLVMMMHDAFMGVDYWAGFLQPPQHEGVVLDTHIYQMFSDAVRAFSIA